MAESRNDPRAEAARRRTFAIISHPDAGKTTLTEKFLLYGGALAKEAGSVKAREGRRSATSDWMDLEQQRGISITSTVLQFEYRDCVVNLLDTPVTVTSPRIPTGSWRPQMRRSWCSTRPRASSPRPSSCSRSAASGRSRS